MRGVDANSTALFFDPVTFQLFRYMETPNHEFVVSVAEEQVSDGMAELLRDGATTDGEFLSRFVDVKGEPTDVIPGEKLAFQTEDIAGTIRVQRILGQVKAFAFCGCTFTFAGITHREVLCVTPITDSNCLLYFRAPRTLHEPIIIRPVPDVFPGPHHVIFISRDERMVIVSDYHTDDEEIRVKRENRRRRRGILVYWDRVEKSCHVELDSFRVFETNNFVILCQHDKFLHRFGIRDNLDVYLTTFSKTTGDAIHHTKITFDVFHVAVQAVYRFIKHADDLIVFTVSELVQVPTCSNGRPEELISVTYPHVDGAIRITDDGHIVTEGCPRFTAPRRGICVSAM